MVNRTFLILTSLFFCSAYNPQQAFSQNVNPDPHANVTIPDSLTPKLENPESEHLSLNHYAAGLKRIFQNRTNLYFLGMAGGLALAIRPYDVQISEELRQEKEDWEMHIPSKLGSFYFLACASVLTYTIGHIFDENEVAETGVYLLEAFTTTYLLTYASKKIIGRTRPNSENTRSFPSGHASGVFTLASVLDKRHGYKIGIPGYLLASFVGFSRIREQKHFPTDVIAGAALGIIVGRSFVSSAMNEKPITVTPAFEISYTGFNLRINF